MASRKIKDLHLVFQPLVRQWTSVCSFAEYTPLIYMTYRPPEEQDILYKKGRTAVGSKVTNVKGGYSWHQYGLAIDFAVKINGKINWECIDLYRVMGHVGKSFGMEWGGDWRSLKDYGHLEYHPNLEIDEAFKHVKKGLDYRSLIL